MARCGSFLDWVGPSYDFSEASLIISWKFKLSHWLEMTFECPSDVTIGGQKEKDQGLN